MVNINKIKQNKKIHQITSQILNSSGFIYSISFLIPATFLTLIFISLGICPFGNNTALVVDMDGQYIDFLSYFKTIILENNNFLYSFSQTLGGNMFGFSSYYLFSPFNLICLPFSRETMPIAVTIIIILKISLSGLTFNIFLKNESKSYYNLTSLLFSTAYALMAYNTAYYYTIIWLDGIILLPLVILGINKIINGQKSIIYTIFLFLSILTNYYIGFMILIFSFLYFTYILLRSSSLKDIKLCKSKEVKKFILSSIFTCGISMFLTLPVLLSLLGSKIQSNMDTKIFELILFSGFTIFCLLIILIIYIKKRNKKKLKVSVFNSMYDLKKSRFSNKFLNSLSSRFNLSNKTLIILISLFILIVFLYSIAPFMAKHFGLFSIFNENLYISDVLSKLYTNSFSFIQINNWDFPETALPQIFTSIFVLYLVFIYFYNPSFSNREKLTSFSFLLIFILSFCIIILGLVWHGFSKPIWFPARFSFLFSFILIYLANRCFLNIINGIELKTLIYSTLSIIGFTFLIGFTAPSINSGVNSAKIYIDLILIIIFSIIIYINIYSKKKLIVYYKKSTTIILFAILYILHFSNIYIDSFHSIKDTQDSYSTTNNYSNIENYSKFISETESIINRIKSNDDSLYRLEKTYQRKTNDPMQFNYNGLSHFSSSEKAFTRVFMEKLGFKNHGNWTYYNKGNTVLLDSILGVKYIISKDSSYKKLYDLYFSDYEQQIYKNQYSLPLGFGVDKEIINLKFDSNKTNPFVNQTQLIEHMSGKSFGNLFTSFEPIEISTENLSKAKLEDSIKYTKIEPNKDAYISYKIKIPNNQNAYAYFSTDPTNPFKSSEIKEASLLINDKPVQEYSLDDGFNCILPLETQKGDTLTFKIKLNDTSFKLNNVVFCYENLDYLANHYSLLSKEPFYAEKISSSYIRGTISIKDNDRLLLLTIPYDEGWDIKIDGVSAKKLKICNTLTAISVPEGEHQIVMRFIPHGLICGVIISILTFVALIIFLLLHRKNRE